VESQGAWVSASDLAEYAYCPRSYYYSTHPDAIEGGHRPDPSARRGVRYHQRTLSAERSHDQHLGLYVGLLLLGLALLALSIFAFGGV
jgi:hypothetical protein